MNLTVKYQRSTAVSLLIGEVSLRLVTLTIVRRSNIPEILDFAEVKVKLSQCLTKQHTVKT
jgi:hypothetical protein